MSIRCTDIAVAISTFPDKNILASSVILRYVTWGLLLNRGRDVAYLVRY